MSFQFFRETHLPEKKILSLAKDIWEFLQNSLARELTRPYEHTWQLSKYNNTKENTVHPSWVGMINNVLHIFHKIILSGGSRRKKLLSSVKVACVLISKLAYVLISQETQHPLRSHTVSLYISLSHVDWILSHPLQLSSGSLSLSLFLYPYFSLFLIEAWVCTYKYT